MVTNEKKYIAIIETVPCRFLFSGINAVAIDRDTSFNSEFMRVIDREMISRSVLLTQNASIFPAKSTRVAEMATRIAAAASFSKWEKWNKKLENFNSSQQVEFSVLFSKNVAAANRRLSLKVVQQLYDHKYAHALAAFIRASRGAEVQDCAPINRN